MVAPLDDSQALLFHNRVVAFGRAHQATPRGDEAQQTLLVLEEERTQADVARVGKKDELFGVGAEVGKGKDARIGEGGFERFKGALALFGPFERDVDRSHRGQGRGDMRQWWPEVDEVAKEVAHAEKRAQFGSVCRSREVQDRSDSVRIGADPGGGDSAAQKLEFGDEEFALRGRDRNLEAPESLENLAQSVGEFRN